MTRNFVLLFLTAALPLTGCNKIKLPFIQKKNTVAAATPTPAPAPATAAAVTAPPAAAAKAEPKPAAPPKPAVNTTASVMVLCYHNIEDKSAMKALTITIAEFEKQLQAIKDEGFSVIGMQDFLAWRRSEKEIPAKSCIITIDDGWVSGYTNAWPLLKKFGYPFTLFIYVNYVGSGGKSLSWEQLAEMRDAGVDIQSHTYSHSNLRSPGSGVDRRTAELVRKDIAELGKDGWLKKEIAGSKEMLEKQLGIKVTALAYPFGIFTQEARKAVADAGYEAAFTVYGQRLTHSSPFDLLGRYAIEAAKPVIFTNALAMIGGGGGAEGAAPPSSQLAATSMVTQPMEGETIRDPNPTLKVNLETLGEVDPESVEMRLSGIGALKVKYDPTTKMAEAKVTQRLRDTEYMVILSAKVNGRKTEARWSFKFDPNAPAGAAPEPPLPPRASGAGTR